MMEIPGNLLDKCSIQKKVVTGSNTMVMVV
jgi:hypothetical protein